MRLVFDLAAGIPSPFLPFDSRSNNPHFYFRRCCSGATAVAYFQPFVFSISIVVAWLMLPLSTDYNTDITSTEISRAACDTWHNGAVNETCIATANVYLYSLSRIIYHALSYVVWYGKV